LDTSLTSYRDRLQERALDLLWGQWCALGVSGSAPPPGARVIDPEALVAATCSFGRADPRMFDEMLDWLRTNGPSVNTQRLRTLVGAHGFHGAAVLSAAAAFLRQYDRSARWRTLAQRQRSAEAEPLFRFRDGKPMSSFGEVEAVFAEHGFLRGVVELRGYSQAFDPRLPACLGMRLRALFGVNVRAEAVLFLLAHPEGANPNAMSRRIGYSQRSVQDALVAMNRSGWIHVREAGREKIYTLGPRLSGALGAEIDGAPQWTAWAPALRYLEALWLALGVPGLGDLSPELQAAEIRQAVEGPQQQTANAGFARVFSTPLPPRGEDYVRFTLRTGEDLLDVLEQ